MSLLVAALGAYSGSAWLLVTAVVGVTLAFGLGQPALMEAVGSAVDEDVRGVALGIATLFFLVGGSVGSAVVGGLSEVLGMPGALLLLAVLPVAGLVALVPQLAGNRRPRPSTEDRPGSGCPTSRPGVETTATLAASYKLAQHYDLTGNMEHEKDERTLGLSTAQVAGSVLAAVSGADARVHHRCDRHRDRRGSRQLVATIGAAIYTWSLRRTTVAVRKTAAQVRQAALESGPLPRTVAQGPLRTMKERAAARSAEQGPESPDPEDPDSDPDSDEDSWRRAIPWGKVLLASLAVTVIALAGITLVEALTGKPISSVTGGSDSQGTTVGNVTGSDTSQKDTGPSDETKPGSDTQDGKQSRTRTTNLHLTRTPGSRTSGGPGALGAGDTTTFGGAVGGPGGCAGAVGERISPASASLIASTNAGRSPGLRLVIRLPSTTTSSSTQFAPAFFRSSATLS